MTTLFELAPHELYQLAVTLQPAHKEQLNPKDVTFLRSRITEWLLLNGFSTLHKFTKSDDSWSLPLTYSCDSCRRKRQEHTYVPKVKESPEKQKLPEDASVLTGEEFITFSVKGKEKIEEKEDPPERASILRYYSSVKECVQQRSFASHAGQRQLQRPVLIWPCWELKHEWVKYGEDDVLGSGQFGKVYKGDLVIVKENQTVRPIKVAVKVTTNDEDHKTLGDTLKEARAMRNIEHPNVIKFYGIVIERDPVMLVIELVNMGSLISHLQKEPSSEARKNKFALQAAWGLEYLHQKKVIHRDIAARNCLLHRPKEGEDEITLKIADFGLSRVGEFYQIKGRHTLPIRYLPYESFNNGMFTSMSDCWMFGALLFEIYSDGSELYEGFKLSRVKERIGKHDLQEIPEAWPKEAKTLIDSCWKKEPKERITMKAAAEILERLTKQKTPVVCNPDMMRKRVGKTKKKTQDGATLVTEGSEKSTKAILRRGKVKGEATERTEGSGKSVQMRVKRKAK